MTPALQASRQLFVIHPTSAWQWRDLASIVDALDMDIKKFVAV